MRTGKIKLFEGKSKKNGKPYTCLELSVGTWTTLYFPQSKFEMDYIKKHLTEDQDDKLDLNED